MEGMRKRMKKRKRNGLWVSFFLLCFVLCLGIPRLTVRAESMQDNPYVRMSPDGYAWTVAEKIPYTQNAYLYRYPHDIPEYWYGKDEVITTGLTSTLRELGEGEHYYKSKRTGMVPVGYWKVSHATGSCIHETDGDEWHGIVDTENGSICGNAYYSGWFAYCADCGELISNHHTYMSRNAARSLTYIDTDLGYFYQCPSCTHLENSYDKEPHECQLISFNRYKVVYDKNVTDTSVANLMEASLHMYNNETVYRGEEITPQTTLTKNSYTRVGYAFTGWNTKPDGSGTHYEDFAEIFNLSLYDYKVDPERGTVTLYAQWKESESTLHLDPAGGAYEGERGIVDITQGYASTYLADPDKLECPDGFTVSFDTDGGGTLAPITATTHFTGWKLTEPFHGRLQENTYYFLGDDGAEDTITAQYEGDPIILPTPSKPGFSFGGWYEDTEGTKPAGFEGDPYTPKGDVTLHAKWVELVLWSYDNYTANDRKGAVDLAWSQPDTIAKTYKLYESKDGKNFSLLYGAKEGTNKNETKKDFAFKSAAETYTVPYTGFYILSASGAQGKGYSTYTGGKGGSVSGKFYLNAGDVITVKVGGQNGYNGGGTASAYGNGGGATTIVSKEKGTLLVAGGGGGASLTGNGGAGGTSTSLTANANGGNGMAGGGGGYKGGKAGEVVKHTHTGTCKHTHTTSCYVYHKHTDETGSCYTYSHSEPIYSSVQCQNCSYWAGHYMWNTKLCPMCGSNNIAPSWKKVYNLTCGLTETSVVGYSCGRDENYICGYTQGQIISAKPAYGGSNFVNSTYAVYQESYSGKQSGNGKASINADMVGFMNGLKLDAVAAPDEEAPDIIDSESVVITGDGDMALQVSFLAPKDNGTQYWYKAESYTEGTGQLLCTSNITTNTLTTGVAGYYYILDTTPEKTVTKANAQNSGSLLTATTIRVLLEEETHYLHIAAVDVAGNIGPTLNLELNAMDMAWSVTTDQIAVTDTINGKDYDTVCHKSGREYYVRADGKGAFLLSYQSYLQGMAREDYQIDYQMFDSRITALGSNQVYTTRIPYSSPLSSTDKLDVTKFIREMQGDIILSDAQNTGASRGRDARDNSFYQAFTIPASLHGQSIVVTPVAGATYADTIIYSDWSDDSTHAVTLIADGVAPTINGTDVLDGAPIINLGEEDIILNLNATDDLSGLRELVVVITNSDSGAKQTFTADETGSLVVDMTQDNALFAGSIVIEIIATDNVGNVNHLQYGALEFELASKIMNARDPSTNVCKKGGTAVLSVVTYGYCDKVVITMPEEIRQSNESLQLVYDYISPEYIQEELLTFAVPLYCEAKNYEFIVRAYKDGQELIAKPLLVVIDDGSVLDDMKVRIR